MFQETFCCFDCRVQFNRRKPTTTNFISSVRFYYRKNADCIKNFFAFLRSALSSNGSVPVENSILFFITKTGHDKSSHARLRYYDRETTSFLI